MANIGSFIFGAAIGAAAVYAYKSMNEPGSAPVVYNPGIAPAQGIRVDRVEPDTTSSNPVSSFLKNLTGISTTPVKAKRKIRILRRRSS
jgi:hypothetical protein